MKINIVVSDRQYAEALGLTLARCLNALISIDGEGEADFVLCDQLNEAAPANKNCGDGNSANYIAVSKFEPVTCVIDRIRAAALNGDGEGAPNVRAIAVTGLDDTASELAALVMARLISRLYGKRVMYLSFGGLGGPSERFVYEVLAKGIVEPGLLPVDPYEVVGAQVDPACSLNPLRRLSSSEVRTFLRLLGSSGAFDLVVISVPTASHHWETCMRACEKTVAVGDKRAVDIMQGIYEAETKSLGRMTGFEYAEKGDADIYGELGVRLRSLVRDTVNDLLYEK